MGIESKQLKNAMIPVTMNQYTTDYCKVDKLPSFENLNKILNGKIVDSYKHVPRMRIPTVHAYTNRYHYRLGNIDRSSRNRRKPYEMSRVYNCKENGCIKGYESISHLNTHIRRKGHGIPLTKADFQ